MAKHRVSFEISQVDSLLVGAIARRARRAAAKVGYRLDVTVVRMELTACHANGCPLDLAKLLATNDATFAHDVHGIARNIDRKTGRLTGHFLPRCALPEVQQAGA